MTAVTNADVEASYWDVADGTVARTVPVAAGILVDVDAEGRIVGIEQVGGVVDMGTLAEVLRTVRL